jgi:hypothetical protein
MQRTKLATSLALLIFTLSVNAEDQSYLLNSTPIQRADSQTRFMKNKLGLSDEQVAAVQDINLEFAKRTEPVLKGASINLIKIKDIKNIQEQKNEALSHVLSELQLNILSNSKDELKDALKSDITHL